MTLRQALVHVLARLLSMDDEELNKPALTTNGTASFPATITQTVTATVTAVTTTSPKPTQSITIYDDRCPNDSSYIYLGCWLEGSTPARLLEDDFTEDDTNMSVEACGDFCSAYALFGVEYGTQCFCANTIASDAGFPIDEWQCQFPCAGNSTEMCGGTGALNMYQNKPQPPDMPLQVNNFTYNYAGCWAEPADGSRALDGYVNRNPGGDVSSCTYICGLSNFTYFGLEYGDECWCGNELSPLAEMVDDAECSFACPGTPTDTCGGGLRLSLYNGTYNSSGLGAGKIPLRM